MNKLKINSSNRKKFQHTKIFIIPILVMVLLVFTSTPVFADVAAPKKQLDVFSSPEKIFCKENLFKIVRTSDNQVSCVKPSTVSKLVELGVAKPVDLKLLEQMKSDEKHPVGYTRLITITKDTSISPKIDSPTKASYNYVFDACAYDKQIKSPEILVTSDSETKNVKLGNKIPPNSCITTSTNIKASDQNTISSILLNKGGVTTKISMLESNVLDLQEKISAEKAILEKLANSTASKSDIDKSTAKIIELRTQLSSAKDDLNRYMYSLYMTPKKSSVNPPLAYTGELKNARVEILTISEQVSSLDPPHNYNVVFKACSNDIIRMPMVTITSDVETKTVKLADKISPKSCQTSASFIKANNKNSINTSLVNNDDLTKTISELENNIASLQSKLSSEQLTLNQITKDKPVNYEEKINKINTEIIKIRTQINESKLTLYQILNQIYQ